MRAQRVVVIAGVLLLACAAAHLAPQGQRFSPVRSQLPSKSAWQNCMRLSFGIVISLGGGSSTPK